MNNVCVSTNSWQLVNVLDTGIRGVSFHNPLSRLGACKSLYDWFMCRAFCLDAFEHGAGLRKSFNNWYNVLGMLFEHGSGGLGARAKEPLDSSQMCLGDLSGHR